MVLADMACLFSFSCLFLEIYWREVEELKFPFGKDGWMP